MMFETATAADVADELRLQRPHIPTDESDAPTVAAWREWYAITRAMAQIFFERPEDLKAFYRRAGLPH